MAEFNAKYVCGLDDVDEEKTIFSIKRFPKYGTSNFCQNSKISPSESFDHFVKHPVKEGETLNSISLKYGLKASTIRRVNRLWDDNIFLCPSLLVPVQDPESLPPDFRGEILTRSEALKTFSKTRQGQKDTSHKTFNVEVSPNSSSSLLINNTNDDLEEIVVVTAGDGDALRENGGDKSAGVTAKSSSTDDYFSKFDSSISKIKMNLEKIEKEARCAQTESEARAARRSKAAAEKSSLAEPSMRFYKNVDGSSEARLQEKFEKLENEIFQL